jgi:catechol 2,3-dioxygenase-like lactoylglutathione lyase family enzyme
MAKIRHISYRAEDVDAMAKFFIDAMGMTMVQTRKDGAIDLSDGSVNISILPLAANRSRRAGLDHIGFSSEDDQEQIRRVEAAGAIKESTRSPYEEKFKGPEGIIVDVGHWPGAASLEKE